MTKCLSALLIIFWLLITNATLQAEDKAANKGKKSVDYRANLAQIPAADPKAAQAITVVKALQGKHPRLLFTSDDIADLQRQMAKDSILKQAADDVIAWAKSYTPPKGTPNFIKEDTPAIWLSGGTYPGLAYAYHLNRDEKIKHTIVAILQTMLNEPYWGDVGELDSSMGAGNNMLMVGLLYDAVCEELEPDFRAKMAAKLLTHARRMWYLGHQEKAVGTIKYWQQDPQNNHRWHRNAGLSACLLAIADEPGLDTGYMLEQVRGEMDFITSWLPEDGDCHEGATYQQFGFMYLALAVRMMDRTLGTTYQSTPALRNAWAQQMHFWAPGRGGNMSFGDDTNGNGASFDRLDASFFIGPQLSRDPLAQAALVSRMDAFLAQKPGQKLPWTMLTFYDSTVTGGDAGKLTKEYVFADLGAVSMRDAWSADAVALTFKCGPYGGYKLNEFAHHTGKATYINVAHDDPDANSFALAKAGSLIFYPGTYSMPKKTETISTFLVDGKGQVNEGSSYTQPVKNVDMRTLANLIGWKVGEKGRLIVEGEAGNSYRDKLDGYRRTIVWMPGDYLLILDHLQADEARDLTWLGVTEKGQLVDAEQGFATAAGKTGDAIGFQVVADQPLSAAMKPVKLEGRRGDLTMDQFRFSAKADTLHVACVIDAWGRKPTVTIEGKGAEQVVAVSFNGTTDTWAWQDAQAANKPTRLNGTRAGKSLIALTEKDLAPVESERK